MAMIPANTYGFLDKTIKAEEEILGKMIGINLYLWKFIKSPITVKDIIWVVAQIKMEGYL